MSRETVISLEVSPLLCQSRPIHPFIPSQSWGGICSTMTGFNASPESRERSPLFIHMKGQIFRLHVLQVKEREVGVGQAISSTQKRKIHCSFLLLIIQCIHSMAPIHSYDIHWFIDSFIDSFIYSFILLPSETLCFTHSPIEAHVFFNLEG